MKYIIKILLFIVIIRANNSIALIVLEEKARYGGDRIIDQVKQISSGIKKRKPNNNAVLKDILNNLKSSNQNLAELNQKIEQRHNSPLMIGTKETIRMMSEFDGFISESVRVISGIKSKIKVSAIDNGIIPKNTAFRCYGTAKGHGINVNCDRMITPDKIYKVNISLKDHFSGEDSIFPDNIMTNEDEIFFKSGLLGVIDAVMDVSKDRLSTHDGEIESTTAKNKILSGAMGGTENIKENIEKDKNSTQTHLILNAGKQIIISFDEGVNL